MKLTYCVSCTYIVYTNMKSWKFIYILSFTENLWQLRTLFLCEFINNKWLTILQKDKYNLEYYVNLARELEAEGAHILAIKDMAGLLKPYAAEQSIKALKKSIPKPMYQHPKNLAY